MSDRSLGHLISEVTQDLSTLMRQELELAKAELQQTAPAKGRAPGCATVAGYFVLLFVSIALWWAIGSATGLGWSAVIGAVLATMGRKSLRSVRGLPSTADTVKGSRTPQRQRISKPKVLTTLFRQTLLLNEGRPMSNDPEQIRREIERTRSELSDNVTAHSEHPSQVSTWASAGTAKPFDSVSVTNRRGPSPTRWWCPDATAMIMPRSVSRVGVPPALRLIARIVGERTGLRNSSPGVVARAQH